MFTFINTSRVGTAVQGVAAAEKGFQHALWYCKERRSMRALSGKKEPEEVADAIIWQPAVRQMLLTQKAVAEGGRSMVYECAPRNPAQTVRNPACRTSNAPPRLAGARSSLTR